VLHAGVVVDSQLRPTGQRYPDVRRVARRAPLQGNPWRVVPGFALAVRTSLLQLSVGRRPDNVNDRPGNEMPFDHWCYLLGWSLEGAVHRPEQLVQYRQHGGNVSGVTTPAMAAVSRAAAGALEYERRAVLADQRAAAFEELTTQHPAAAAASEYWREVSGACRLRAAAHRSSASLPARAGAITRLAVSGSYGKVGTSDAAWRSLARDIVTLGSRGSERARER
jgi:hypothetical protein